MIKNRYLRSLVTLTCIALTVITHTPASEVIAVREGIQQGIVVAGVSVAIALAHLAWVGIVCLSISPRFVIEERLAAVTGITLCVVGTLTHCIDAAPTST